MFHKSLIDVHGFYAVWMVYLGKKTGLFGLIASNKGPIAPSDLAKKSGLFALGVEGWCSTAVCLGYLSEKNGRVSLSPEVREVVLDEHSPYYAAGQFAYSALRSLEYEAFDELFASGKPKYPSSPKAIEAIEEATAWDHYSLLRSLIIKNKKIHALLSKGCKVLDVGCGVGKFMQRAKAVYPRSVFVGIDLYANEVTAAMRSKRKPTSRTEEKEHDIAILYNSAETMTFEEEYDVLYLGETLYLIDDKRKGLTNCYRALKKRGSIVILEGLRTDVDGCRICEQDKTVMAMQLDFVLQGHPFMRKKELMALLKETGFRNIKFSHLGASFFLVTADKPDL